MTDPNSERVLAHRRLSSALNVKSPFPWQLALLDRFLDGNAPKALDVPTGLGKTAVMAIWLVARAAGARVPRRLVYVVDRRAVVDQATSVAEQLRTFAAADPTISEALGLHGPLPISTLRGKHLDNREWLTDPSTPAIVLGTVDMIGSRILFSGYGISRKMRPYHASLLGVDSLIVLDEAHLVPPFERLIESIASGRDGDGRSLRVVTPDEDYSIPSVRFLSLSATGRARADHETLVLGDADRAHEVVAQRLRATKRVIFREEVSTRDLPERLLEEAWALTEDGAMPRRCIIFCNSRDDAEKVKTGLETRKRKAGLDGVETELFVGGRRLFERERAAEWLEEHGFLARSKERPAHAMFVVATSAGEVGVDLDADDMVCDLVTWERMVQRLGRVNRRGEGNARVVVVPATPDTDELRARLAAVREVFEALARREGQIDGSPGALITVKARADLAATIEHASTPPPLHPPLRRATVEAWSMTSLDEHSGRPEVGAWIRGWIDEEEPQTTIVWRQNLPVDDRGRLFGERDLETFRNTAEPHLAERLETETSRAVAWLDARLNTLSKLEDGEVGLAPSERSLRKTDVAGVIFRGDAAARPLAADDLSNKQKRDAVKRALAGALLMVDCRLGGLSYGLLDHESSDASDVTTLDDDRLLPFRHRRVTTDREEAPGWRREACIALRESDDEVQVWLLIESLAREAAESEEGRSVSARREQKLDEHQCWAEQAATRIGTGLGLPERYRAMLEVAARLHDEGKRTRCWQRAFKARSDGTYAKTTARPNLHLLNGYRHELGSLPYAERHERLQGLDPTLRELCLHLIAAHHGNARPLLRTDGAEEPPTRLVQRSQEIALRFARLEKQWGPWGLAWWETLLRAADQQASQRNDFEGGDRG